MSQPTTPAEAVKSPHERDCLDYWDNKRDDSINLLPGTDGLVHSHFSVVDFDRSVLDAPPEVREDKILEELHRLENRQVELFLDALGPIPADARVMDSGCGRGGTAFILHQRTGCFIDGVDFSPYRLEFARKLAAGRGIQDRVRFHRGNTTDTGFPDNHFQFAYNNEAAEPLESMDELCREVARVLQPGGLYAAATWVANDTETQKSAEIAAINRNYLTRVHTRAAYLKGMVNNGLIPRHIADLTADALPYWELREHSVHRTGVEQPFVTAFSTRLMNYLFIVAEYQPAE
jgi:geranyl diphosphate 2-C-methyltransferase